MHVIDLNVCLYAINEESVYHKEAKAQLERLLNGQEVVAFAWVVLLGFMRITTNPRIMPDPLQPEQAASIIDEWLELPVVEILQPGREHWILLKEMIEESGTAANLTTDAHLAALVIPFQSDQAAIATKKDLLYDFLGAGKRIAVFGDSTPDWIDAQWEDRPVNKYWRVETPDQPPISHTNYSHPAALDPEVPRRVARAVAEAVER